MIVLHLTLATLLAMRNRWAGGIGAVALVALLTMVAAGCGDSGDDGDGGSGGSGGSSDQPAQSSGPRTYEAGDSITVRSGSTFVIALEANPTTGYSWSAQPNANVVYVSSRQVSGRSVPGAPGTQRLTFRATAVGSSTLVLGYSRPFEPGTPPVETESFPVTVNG